MSASRSVRTLARMALAVACLPAVAMPAAAQEANRVDLESLLAPKVSAATKRAQDPRAVPASVIVLTDEDIRQRGYQDLEDALRDLPGISFMDNPLAESGGARIVFRGQPGNDKLALLLNGHRILMASRPQDGTPMFLHNFPLAFVKRLEVVYGPGSALYGADAVAAVINIVTKDGADSPGLVVGSAYGLRDTASTHLGYGGALGEDGNFLVAGRYFHTSGEAFDRFPQFVASAPDRQYWPGSKTRDASAGSEFELVSYRHQGFSFDFVRTAANSASSPSAIDARYASNDQARWLNSTNTLNLDYTTMLGPVHATTTLTYDVMSLNPNSRYVFNAKGDAGATDPAVRAAYLDGYKFGSGRTARLEQTFVHEESVDLALVGGVVAEDHNAMPQTIDLSRPMNPNQSITDQGFGQLGVNWLQYQNYGAYGQVQLGYVPGLSTTLGGRFDYNTRYEPTFTPRLGLVYDLSPQTTLKASFDRSYLAPSVGDMYATWGVPGEYMWSPNPALRPVRGQALELSAQHDFTPDRSLALAVYRNDLTDQIGVEDVAPRDIQGKLTPGAHFVNIDKSTLIGGELRLNARLTDELSGFANASLLDAHLYPGGNMANATSVPDSVGAMAHLGLVYQPWSWLTLSPRFTWQSGRATTPNNPIYQGATIPGAMLADLAVRADVDEHLSLQVVGTNLLDAMTYADGEYQSFSLGGAVPQNGRRVQVGVTYAF